MIQILLHIEKNLLELLLISKLNSMYIDYHKPFVKRVWFQYSEYRVYLHCIEPCDEPIEALYHPHPWKSAIRIISGRYEMGVGHSATTDAPKTDCKLILPQHTIYEMTEPNGWHYVSPMDIPAYSLMVTGEKTNRQMPVEPKKGFRKLTTDECFKLIIKLNVYYNLMLPIEKIQKLSKQASS